MPQSDQDLTIKKETLASPEQAEQPAVQPEKVPADIEVGPKPEIKPEQEVEEIKTAEEKIEEAPPTTKVTPAEPAVQPNKKSQTLEKIEDILQEDIEDIYFEMTPEKQQEFKQVGEKTAQEIETILSQVKVKVREIIKLIKEWLKIVPGINKFFLEQEVKIKTDKILDIKPQASPEDKSKQENKI